MPSRVWNPPIRDASVRVYSRVNLGVVHLNGSALDNHTTNQRPTLPWTMKPALAHVLIVFTRETVACNIRVAISLWTVDRGKIGLAQARRRLNQCIEHGLQVER